MATKYQQCKLVRYDLGKCYIITMYCWLDYKKLKKAKVGDRVTLIDSEEPDLIWRINEIYNIKLDADDIKGDIVSKNWFRTDYERRLSND